MHITFVQITVRIEISGEGDAIRAGLGRAGWISNQTVGPDMCRKRAMVGSRSLRPDVGRVSNPTGASEVGGFEMGLSPVQCPTYCISPTKSHLKDHRNLSIQPPPIHFEPVRTCSRSDFESGRTNSIQSDRSDPIRLQVVIG